MYFIEQALHTHRRDELMRNAAKQHLANEVSMSNRGRIRQTGRIAGSAIKRIKAIFRQFSDLLANFEPNRAH